MKRLIGTVAVIGSVLLSAVPASGCSVCFAAPEDPMTQGATFGMLVMIAVTVAMLLGFGSFFITLARRERAFGKLTTEEP
jgi:hypothetical protein|tara:strand:- start:169 stop:408 length:240 start_codon:yes stop_codon:yes gene_type:complete